MPAWLDGDFGVAVMAAAIVPLRILVEIRRRRRVANRRTKLTSRPGLIDRLVALLFKDTNDALWDWTYEWERAHSNAASLWTKEPDPEGVKAAFALSKSDPEAGFQMYLNLAGQGSIWSMIEVAKAYRNGTGTTRDFGLADEWYRRAISAGSWMAARDYAQFLGDQGNFAACEEILRDGVKKGWTPAFFWLAWFRRHPRRKGPRDWLEIRSLLEYAAEKGHPAAQHYLASLLMHGRFGLREMRRGSRLCDEFGVKLAQRSKDAADRQST